MGFQPLSPPRFLLPSSSSLSPGRSLSLSSFSPFFKQELAWSQHHLEICMGKAAAAPPPGGVPGARGKVWGGGRGGRETWSCKDCRSASRGFPPLAMSLSSPPAPPLPHLHGRSSHPSPPPPAGLPGRAPARAPFFPDQRTRPSPSFSVSELDKIAELQFLH